MADQPALFSSPKWVPVFLALCRLCCFRGRLAEKFIFNFWQQLCELNKKHLVGQVRFASKLMTFQCPPYKKYCSIKLAYVITIIMSSFYNLNETPQKKKKYKLSTTATCMQKFKCTLNWLSEVKYSQTPLYSDKF